MLHRISLALAVKLGFICLRAFACREEFINTVNIEKKEIYGSRSHSASPSGNGNGNGDKVGESLQSVFELALESQGAERTAQMLEKLVGQLRSAPRPSSGQNTPYHNTIPVEEQPPYPGDWRVE